MIAKWNDLLLQKYVNIKCLMLREDGQDLIEYALLAALLALAATVTIQGIGTDINAVFTTIGTNLTTSV